MVLRELSDRVPYSLPPDTPCFLSPQHEVVSTSKAKINNFFKNNSDKEAKIHPWNKFKL